MARIERIKLSEGETMSDDCNKDATEPFAEAHGSATGIEWPDEPGEWTRHGEHWTAKRTADGQMWIIPPCPEDGCVPRMLAALAEPPVLGGWVKSPNASSQLPRLGTRSAGSQDSETTLSPDDTASRG